MRGFLLPRELKFDQFVTFNSRDFFQKHFVNFHLARCLVTRQHTLNQPNRFTVSWRINETFGLL